MTDYKHGIISADSHVIEAHDLWQTYTPERYRDRAPKMIRDTDTDRMVGEGVELPPVGLLAGVARSNEEVRLEGRWEEDVFPGGYDPDARMADLDRDGIDAEILFPTIGMQLYPLSDLELQWVLFRAYNDWLADFCSAHPDRLKGIAMLNHEDVDEAIRELKRAKDLGHVGVMVPLYAGEENPYYDRRYDPLWAAAVEYEMPVNLHAATTRDKSKAWNKGTMTTSVLDTYGIQAVLLDMIFYGLFDRFPELMVVSAENDVGWAGSMLERADYHWERNRKLVTGGDQVVCKEQPSRYFHDNVRVTFMRDHTGVLARKVIGTQVMMWGNDFPHHVSTWPHSQQVIDEHFEDQPDEVRKAIVFDNVRSLYGF